MWKDFKLLSYVVLKESLYAKPNQDKSKTHNTQKFERSIGAIAQLEERLHGMQLQNKISF